MLTYYGVLSIFPGLLVLVSIVSFASRQSVQPILDSLSAVAPAPYERSSTRPCRVYRAPVRRPA